MTLEQGVLIPSKRFDVFQRLYTRYTLEPLPAAGSIVGLSPIIIPITNVDELLRRSRVIQDTVSFEDISTGQTTGLVCPAGLRRQVTVVEFTRLSGDRNQDILSVIDANGGSVANQPIRLNIQTAASFLLVTFGQPVQMDEGDSLAFTITGGTTDGDWQARILCSEEDAF